MKHVYFVSGVLCLATAVSLAAQTSRGTAQTPAKPPSSATMDRAGMEQAIIESENRVNDAIAKGNLTAFKTLVADTAWTVDSNGPMSAIDFEKNFAQIKLEPGWKISDSRIVWSDTNTAVHIYKWTGQGTFQGQAMPPVTWSSTVWNLRKGKWVAVSHQETTAK